MLSRMNRSRNVSYRSGKQSSKSAVQRKRNVVDEHRVSSTKQQACNDTHQDALLELSETPVVQNQSCQIEQLGLHKLVVPSEVGLPRFVHMLSPRSQDALEEVSLLNGWVVPPVEVVEIFLRLSAGQRQGILSEEQRFEVYKQLEDGNKDVAYDLLNGLGVYLEPDAPAQEIWECNICFCEQDLQGWRCPQGHRYCSVCMNHHVESTAFPRCPTEKCGYELAERDFRLLAVPSHRFEAFTQALLQRAIDQLCAATTKASKQPPPCDSTRQYDTRAFKSELQFFRLCDRTPTPIVDADVLIRCSDAECSNAVLAPRQARRFCYACPCGARPFCTTCREAYHFHGACGELQDLRQRWLKWITEDRRHFHSCRAGAEVYTAQMEALKDSLRRRQEFEGDERYKEQHCRLCPACQHPVEKTEGCDNMKCGEDAHGGNRQHGCGFRFKWSQAVPYVFNGHSAAQIHHVTAEEVRCRGRETLHPFVNCDLCGSNSAGIIGPRFRCLHCPDFNVCLKCEPELAATHEPDHVFEIMFESDFKWRQLFLPNGTKVRTVHNGPTAPWGSLSHDSAPHQLVDVAGEILHVVVKPDKRNRRAPWGYRVMTNAGPDIASEIFEIPAEHLEPILKSSAEAESLIQDALRTAEQILQTHRQDARKQIWQRPEDSERLKKWREELYVDAGEDSGDEQFVLDQR